VFRAQALSQADFNYRGDYQTNIVVTGGSSMFRGFRDRLQKELEMICNGDIKVFATPERQIGAYVGGVVLCSMTTFQSMWFTKEEYMLHGAGLVHKKCC
jgi:actin-related protein